MRCEPEWTIWQLSWEQILCPVGCSIHLCSHLWKSNILKIWNQVFAWPSFLAPLIFQDSLKIDLRTLPQAVRPRGLACTSTVHGRPRPATLTSTDWMRWAGGSPSGVCAYVTFAPLDFEFPKSRHESHSSLAPAPILYRPEELRPWMTIQKIWNE